MAACTHESLAQSQQQMQTANVNTVPPRQLRGLALLDKPQVCCTSLDYLIGI